MILSGQQTGEDMVDLALLVEDGLAQAGGRRSLLEALELIDVAEHLNRTANHEDIEEAIRVRDDATLASRVCTMLMDRQEPHLISQNLYWTHNSTISTAGIERFAQIYFDVELLTLERINAWIAVVGFDRAAGSDFIGSSMREMFWRWRTEGNVSFNEDEMMRYIMISSVFEADMLRPGGQDTARLRAMHRDVAARCYGMLRKHEVVVNKSTYEWGKHLIDVEPGSEDSDEDPIEFERVDPSAEQFPPRRLSGGGPGGDAK